MDARKDGGAQGSAKTAAGEKSFDYDSHENVKLTEHEIQLLEYSFFSLCEEIDLFFCERKEPDVSSDTEFTADSIETKLMQAVDGLESYEYDSEQWRSNLRKLYLFTMGSYRLAG